MVSLVPPHGSDSLKPLLLPKTERAEETRRAERLKRVPLTSREVSDLFMLGMGAYTPLDGFMGEANWRGCCENMKLENGLFWPIPITLSCEQALGDSIEIGEDVALEDSETGELLGILRVAEKYAIDREFECSRVFRTTDTAHPGVAKVMSQGPVNLGGRAGRKSPLSRRATRCIVVTNTWPRSLSRYATASSFTRCSER
jgi:sulfate adenylyltransferase